MNRFPFAPWLRFGMGALLLSTLALAAQAQTVDTEAKERTGPALKTIAEKYRGRDDAVAVLVKHTTTGPKITIDDEEETHKTVQSQDEAQILHLVRYILSH